jgi:M6 family metalloprotease-like protein
VESGVVETSVVESADGSEVFYQRTLRRPDGSRTSYHSTSSEEVVEENPLPSPSLGRRDILVILAEFPNAPRNGTTVSDVESLVFTADVSVRSHFDEDSYGKLQMEGDVVDWVTLPFDLAEDHCFESVQKEKIALAAIRAARESRPDLDVQSYEHVMIIQPYSAPCQVYAGTGTIGAIPLDFQAFSLRAGGSWINAERVWPKVMAHELGHNLGSGHGYFRECGFESSDAPDCEDIEYKDVHTIMGGVFGPVHNDAVHKDKLGYFGSGDVVDVTRSGEYAIGPLSTPLSSLPKILRIRRWNQEDETLYIEYRQLIGFDHFFIHSPTNVAEGPIMRIHRKSDYTNRGLITTLIDPSIPPEGYFLSPALPVGQKFDVPRSRVSIETISANSEQTTLRITFRETSID